MKKYTILALTFFGIICGQFGYGQGFFVATEQDGILKIEWDDGELDEIELIGHNNNDDNYDSGDVCDYNSNAYDYYECHKDDFANNDIIDCNGDAYGYAYESSCGCIGGNTGIDECPDEGEGEDQGTPPEPETPKSWYFDSDGDGYHSQTTSAVSTPGAKWKTTTTGADCDDNIFNTLNDCSKVCNDEEYEQAIRKGDIFFTKKYGWVDRTHAFRDTSRDSPIGVNNLWKQLKEPPSQSQIYMGYYSVNYKQDILRAGVSIGIERQFLVRPGLTLEQRKSVALAILQNVSIAFELLQSAHPTSTSSFEPADLPSNMLNFYRHVEGLTEQQILDAIEPVSIEQSIEVLRSYPCTFASDEYKNRSFEPVRFESPYTSQDFGVPDMLNTIVPYEVRPATDFGNADLILLEQDIISN